MRPLLDFSGTAADAAKGGDIVYTRSSYTMTVSDPKHKPITDEGKYVTIFKKQADGSWRAVVDMVNSDLPMPQLASK
jgi:ketosteroid isomerase-like protein